MTIGTTAVVLAIVFVHNQHMAPMPHLLKAPSLWAWRAAQGKPSRLTIWWALSGDVEEGGDLLHGIE
jgi:hypothetical protein